MVVWKDFGQHAAYGNGLRRAKLRGWVYLCVAIFGSAFLQQNDLGPSRQHLAVATIFVYWWGSVLHLVPFETGFGYCTALAVDFCVITSVYSCHIIVYCGQSPATALSLGLSLVCICSTVVSTVSGRDIQYSQGERRLRMVCGITHTLLLAAVEMMRARDASLATLVVASKLAAFVYFYLGGRIDSPTHWKACTVPGVWDVHENFHVIVLGVHMLQVYAVGIQATPNQLDDICKAASHFRP